MSSPGRAPVPAVACGVVWCGVVEQEGQHCLGDAPEIRGSGPDSGPCDSPEHRYSHGSCAKLLWLTPSPALSPGLPPCHPPRQTVNLSKVTSMNASGFISFFLFLSFAVLPRDGILSTNKPKVYQHGQNVKSR